jgi:hypothetical protein
MKLFEKIDVPKNQRGTGQYIEGEPTFQEDLKASSCDPVFLFQWLVWIGDGADEDAPFFWSLELPGQYLRRVDFHVHKFAPGLTVSCKALHKARVAISTTVLTSHVGVDAVIISFYSCFCKDCF